MRTLLMVVALSVCAALLSSSEAGAQTRIVTKMVGVRVVVKMDQGQCPTGRTISRVVRINGKVLGTALIDCDRDVRKPAASPEKYSSPKLYLSAGVIYARVFGEQVEGNYGGMVFVLTAPFGEIRRAGFKALGDFVLDKGSVGGLALLGFEFVVNGTYDEAKIGTTSLFCGASVLGRGTLNETHALGIGGGCGVEVTLGSVKGVKFDFLLHGGVVSQQHFTEEGQSRDAAEYVRSGVIVTF